MKQNIKRINLSFDLNRETDKQAYELITGQQRKTAFIVRTILQANGIGQNISINEIKQALKEVLSEEYIKPSTLYERKKETSNNEIPNEVFNIFEKI